MSSPMSKERQTRWTASTVAVLATLLTLGGPVALADHYARSGASWDTSGYDEARHAAYDAGNRHMNISAETTRAYRDAEAS